MSKLLKLTEKRRESNGKINKAAEIVYDEILMEYEQSFIQDFQIFLRAMRKEEGYIQFILQVFISKFVTYEIPPGIYDGSGKKTLYTKYWKLMFVLIYHNAIKIKNTMFQDLIMNQFSKQYQYLVRIEISKLIMTILVEKKRKTIDNIHLQCACLDEPK